MTEKPALDPEVHEDDTVVSVWKRRMILILLIGLVIAVAAPTFAGCGNFLSSRKTVAAFEVAGKSHEVSDEDLHRFAMRFNASERVFGDPRMAQGLPDGEEGVKETLRVLMLDAAAKAEGVHIPDKLIMELIQSRPQFQVAGKFDEGAYRRALTELGGRGNLNHEGLTEILRTRLSYQEYARICLSPIEIIPGEDAYESWKKRNVKLSVDFVASPFEAQRAKFASVQPTDEQLKDPEFVKLPQVRQALAVPPAKTVEVAYLKVADMTPERFEKAKLFAEQSELVTEEEPLISAAFVLFHENKDTVFTKARWVEATDPGYTERKRAAEEKHAAWEKLSKEEKEKQPEPPLEKNPADDYPAEDARAQFDKWKELAEKEALAQKIVRHMGLRAEREGKSLAELAAEFAQFGVRAATNDPPLPDSEMVEKFPDDVARNSEFDQVLRQFKAPAEGAVFKPQYHAQPIPTTRLAERFPDRGFMVMRLAASDPARSYQVEEKRDVLVEIWRKRSVGAAAKAVLAEIKKKAEEAGPEIEKRALALRSVCAEAGLPVQTLRRFNARTEAPKPPTAPPGQTLAPDVEAVARRVALRNFVQQGYTQMTTMEPGKFVEPFWVDDDKMQAALLILLLEKHEPTPVEMQEADVTQERFGLMRQSAQQAEEIFGYDTLAKRFKLLRFDEKAAEVKAAPSK